MPAYRPGRVNGELVGKYYKFIDDLWQNGKKDR